MFKRLLLRGAERLIARSYWTPYDHLGDYMERFWVVPNRRPSVGKGCGPVKFRERPIAWVLQRFDIAVRAHRILKSDLDRAFHDHPWSFVSIIVDGSYVEVTPVIDGSGIYRGEKRVRYSQGDILLRGAKQLHRLELTAPVWTLFITGPWRQRWGFFPGIENRKVYYKDYLEGKDHV